MLSPLATDHVNRPRNQGALEGATHVGSIGARGEGPYLTLHFLVVGDTIVKVSYETYGCASAIACASVCAEILRGRSVAAAQKLDAASIITLLGGLPEGKRHCADMAAQAIESAFTTGGSR